MEEKLAGAREIGLVLSGGGVRGMAHIGLLRALNENGIRPSQLSGTSVGAIVGALYCNGNNPDEMLAFFRETPLFRYNFLTLNKPGLLDTERYAGIFRSYFPGDSFEALGKSLFVTTTNLQKGEHEVFREGQLIRPLLASAALPPVFSPVEINNYLHADGGIMDNFPSEVLHNQCDYIIGSNVAVLKAIAKDAIRTSIQLANRTTALMIYAINKGKMASCDLLFEPAKLDQIGVLDKRSLEKAHDIGYDHASRLLEKVLQD
jgi:NTE family protein